jgi:glycerophosphoryl diester phosphodiesterase
VKILKGLFVALLSVIVLVAAVYLFAPVHPMPDHPYFDANPVVIAHRGGNGLWPENTIYAFRHAAEMGVDVLEMDVRATADGALVVIHNDRVDRTTDGRGRVEDLHLEELESLDAGYRWTDDDGQTYPFRGKGIRVPTLQEVLEVFPAKRMVIEIKPPSTKAASAFCQIVTEYSRENTVLVASFHNSVMETFRRECPRFPTAATPEEVRSFLAWDLVYLGKLFRPRAELFGVPESLGPLEIVTPRFVSLAHRLNTLVQVWTVNEAEDMKRLLEMGVDGIMTDYPDRLFDLLKENQTTNKRE